MLRTVPRFAPALVTLVALAAGCSGSRVDTSLPDLGHGLPGSGDLALDGVGGNGGGTGGGGDMAGGGGGGGGSGGDMSVPPVSGDLITQLLELTKSCTAASKAKYATDEGGASNIDICKLNGAFFWKSDFDIDCDGQRTTECNEGTDDAYFNDTSFPQSDGKPLIAAQLPFIVVPLPSNRFDYTKSNIQPGAVAAVIYNGKLSFGVFGDEGPEEIIGEGSYAMAKSLGIDSNPNTGGIESGATFIVFTGTGAVVSPIESHPNAVTLGTSLATKLVQNGLLPAGTELQ
jgi:glycosyl hydrolase group 75 (putative chitosanase)